MHVGQLNCTLTLLLLSASVAAVIGQMLREFNPSTFFFSVYNVDCQIKTTFGKLCPVDSITNPNDKKIAYLPSSILWSQIVNFNHVKANGSASFKMRVYLSTAKHSKEKAGQFQNYNDTSPRSQTKTSMSNTQADFNLKSITLKRCQFPAVKIKTIWMARFPIINVALL